MSRFPWEYSGCSNIKLHTPLPAAPPWGQGILLSLPPGWSSLGSQANTQGQ